MKKPLGGGRGGGTGGEIQETQEGTGGSVAGGDSFSLKCCGVRDSPTTAENSGTVRGCKDGCGQLRGPASQQPSGDLSSAPPMSAWGDDHPSRSRVDAGLLR